MPDVWHGRLMESREDEEVEDLSGHHSASGSSGGPLDISGVMILRNPEIVHILRYQLPTQAYLHCWKFRFCLVVFPSDHPSAGSLSFSCRAPASLNNGFKSVLMNNFLSCLVFLSFSWNTLASSFHFSAALLRTYN